MTNNTKGMEMKVEDTKGKSENTNRLFTRPFKGSNLVEPEATASMAWADAASAPR
jgi:hypothetical protein